MTDASDIKPAVAPSTAEAFAAAIARIRQVSGTKTLIDRIPDEEWLDASADSWNINCGVGNGDADELDGADGAAATAA